MATEYIYLKTTDSTNLYASKHIAKTNPQDIQVYYTFNQSGGKGQFGREWYSGKDKDVCMSVVFPWKNMKVDQNAKLLMTTAMAVRTAFMVLTGIAATIKWPNDIYYEDKKVGGILVQNILKGSKINHTIIGVGINVNTKRFPKWIPNPVSVVQITQQEFELENFVRLLSSAMIQYMDIRILQNLKATKQEYLLNLYKYKKEIKYKNKKGEIKWGTVHGVTDSAHLVIKDSDGERHTYDHGEIQMIFQ